LSSSNTERRKEREMFRGLQVVVAVVLLSTGAMATPITYKWAGTGTGTFSGTPFTNAAFMIALTGDTSTITGSSPVFTLAGFTTTITVNGFSATTSTTNGLFNFMPASSQFFYSPQPGSGNISQVLLSNGSDFATWNMVSSLGPESAVLFNPDPSLLFTTGAGIVAITSLQGGSATFTATTTPEPSTTLLLLLGGTLSLFVKTACNKKPA